MSANFRPELLSQQLPFATRRRLPRRAAFVRLTGRSNVAASSTCLPEQCRPGIARGPEPGATRELQRFEQALQHFIFHRAVEQQREVALDLRESRELFIA